MEPENATLEPSPTVSLDHARAYLYRVLPWPHGGGDTSAYMNIHWTVPNTREQGGRPWWRGRACQSIDECIRAVEYAMKRPDTLDIYVCMSSQRIAAPKVVNGYSFNEAERSQKGAVHLKSLFIDIDVKDGAYSTSKDAAHALAHFVTTTGLPRPTLTVASGSGGLHVYWCLDRALTVPEWQPLAHALAEASRQVGLICDTACTVDAARVLRVPGTFNKKSSPPKPVTLHLKGLQQVDYPVDQIAAVLAPYTVRVPVPVQDPGLEGFTPSAQIIALATNNDELSAGIEQFGTRPVDLGLVAQECGFVREALTTGGQGFGNPLWNLTTLIATFSEAGREAAHVMAKGHPTYDPASTDELYDRKLREREERDLGWPKCASVQNAGCTSCAGCPHLQGGLSPLHHGRHAALEGGGVLPAGSSHGPSTPIPRGALPVASLPLVPPKRQWLHGTDLARGAVSLLVAPGARGKSSWMAMLGLACASGRPLLGAHIFGGPLRVLHLSVEDPTPELALRLRGAMQHHGLSDADVPGLLVAGADRLGISLLQALGSVASLDPNGWALLRAEVERARPDVLMLDPLISILGGASANDNSAAALLMRELVRFAAEWNMAIMVAHHAAKGRDPASAESAMGAASFTNLARIVLGIEPLAAADAGRVGLPPWEAKSVFRVVGTKQNLSRADASDRWFRLASTRLPNAEPPTYPNGDEVGVVEVFRPGQSGPAFPPGMIRDALRVIGGAAQPLSPSRRAHGRFAGPFLVSAIAPHRGGSAGEAEAVALLDHLMRAGLVAVAPVKVQRPGGRSDTRDGLCLTDAGAHAAQIESEEGGGARVPASSPHDDAG